jgi:DNA-binding NarL/FixJ family response regulator
MPGVDGLEITRQIKAEAPNISIIIMTNYDDDRLMMDTIRVGASGYLLKDATRELLVHAIHAVAAGGLMVDATVLRQALTSGALTGQELGPKAASEAVPPQISELDTRLLQLLAEGRTSREIALERGLPEVAAKKHIQALVSSLRANNRTQAVAIAVRLGLIN